jgi:cellulose synthase/poly-beta-1,6-N-acetylglucosamine synthase-like glycosyltransferase
MDKISACLGIPVGLFSSPRTEYVVKLDSDDELHPDYVQKVLAALRKHPTAGYAHVAVQEIDGNGINKQLRLLARKACFQSDEESLRASVSGYRVAANICMFRRAALQAVDYYRSDLGFADDWDLAVRLADAGWGNVYVNEVLASYRVWDTPSSARSRRKLAEIEGCRRVIEESLIPAFKRRGWRGSSIKYARRRMALRHAESLRLKQFNEAEQNGLKAALSRLGDSLALRWKFCWIRTPLALLIQLPSNLATYIKALCKAALFQIGR